jgi:hypothetical protein
LQPSSQHDSKRIRAFVKPYFGNEGINNLLIGSETVGGGKLGPRSPGSGPGGSSAREPGELAGPCSLLDPYTPNVELRNSIDVASFFRLRRTKTQRKLYSRIYWGLQLPGRYAFLTLTNSGKGPEQIKRFLKFKIWLRRHYPGIAACRCFTDEGNGVLHIVIRQGMRQKRIDKAEMDAYWLSVGGGFTWIKRVHENGKAGLAAYMADQRRKRGMSKEMSNQSLMTKYNYIGQWLPPGWLRQFGRVWYRTNGMILSHRLLYLKKWLLDYHKDPACWTPRVPVTWDNDVGWVDMMPEELAAYAR